jgi:hypothetical protein
LRPAVEDGVSVTRTRRLAEASPAPGALPPAAATRG